MPDTTDQYQLDRLASEHVADKETSFSPNFLKRESEGKKSFMEPKLFSSDLLRGHTGYHCLSLC